MTKPHKHAEVIKAWADGAQIQFRLVPDDEWEDIHDPTWVSDVEYRVKPANVVRFAGVARGPNGSHQIFQGVTSRECATKWSAYGYCLTGILRIELDPDTGELVSATMEKP